MYNRCDIAIAQLKTIIAMRRSRLIGEACAIERAVKPVAAAVACEDAARAIAAMRGGRKTDDQQPRICVAETRHRPAPIRFTGEATDFLARHLFTPGDETRAARAVDNLILQDGKLGIAVGGWWCF